MNATNGKFYDVNGNDQYDIACQYRAPAPCPDGFRYYVDEKSWEYGMSSCVAVFPADVYSTAALQCGLVGGSPILNQAITYNHLITFHNISSTALVSSPLTKFVANLSSISGMATGENAGTMPGLYWTGALIQGGVLSWSDRRLFDSAVRNPDNYSPATIAGGTYVGVGVRFGLESC